MIHEEMYRKPSKLCLKKSATDRPLCHRLCEPNKQKTHINENNKQKNETKSKIKVEKAS